MDANLLHCTVEDRAGVVAATDYLQVQSDMREIFTLSMLKTSRALARLVRTAGSTYNPYKLTSVSTFEEVGGECTLFLPFGLNLPFGQTFSC